MVTKIRKQIYIEPYQEAMLKRVTNENDISEAEFIRQAIDHHGKLFKPTSRNPAAWEEEKRYIKALIQQGPALGQRVWQREDLYDR